MALKERHKTFPLWCYLGHPQQIKTVDVLCHIVAPVCIWWVVRQVPLRWGREVPAEPVVVHQSDSPNDGTGEYDWATP